MSFRMILPFCALMIFGCAHTPEAQEPEFRGPASTSEFDEKDLGRTCDSKVLASVEKTLVKLFAWHRESIVTLCEKDPLTPNYFKKDLKEDTNPESVNARVKAFCQYNPAMRLCILCNFEQSGKKTTLAENFESCQRLLLKSESPESFRADVLTPRTN